jgi:hypothetical protein
VFYRRRHRGQIAQDRTRAADCILAALVFDNNVRELKANRANHEQNELIALEYLHSMSAQNLSNGASTED